MAQVSVIFAALTGNVSYLYQAIHLLLSDASQTLGDEVFCNAILAKIKSPTVYMTNSHDVELDLPGPIWTDRMNFIYNITSAQDLEKRTYDFKNNTIRDLQREKKL